MRKSQLTLISLFLLIISQAFTIQPQTAQASVSLLDSQGQPVNHITDGDTVHLQVILLASTSQPRQVTFSLEGQSFVLGFCSIPAGQTGCATPALNALGWHWSSGGIPQDMRTLLASDENSAVLARSAPFLVAPRPVVMVHGFISNWETWIHYMGTSGFLSTVGLAGFAVGDGQVPGTLNTGIITDPAGRTNTIGQNADVLGQYIAAVKQQTGAQMVDLLVHSMGGMISRYYIDRVMQGRDVAQLIMLGSPMGGSDCAVLPAALGFYLPASIEIRQSYMTGIFNQQITRRRGVEFYDLAGTAITEAIQSPCSDVPNDTVVSSGSVNAIPLQASDFNIIHSSLTVSQPVFDSFVRPLLQKTADQFQTAPDLLPAAVNQPPLQFTRIYSGHVPAGGSNDLIIQIDPGLQVASFALFDVSRSLLTVVRGASGNVIELSPEANGLIKVDDPAALFHLGYGFREPKPGPWQISLQTTSLTPTDGVEYAISVHFVGGAVLKAISSTLVPQVGEQVNFTAQLALGGQPLPILSGEVRLMDEEGQVTNLPLTPGTQAGASWVAEAPGTHAVDVVVTGQALDGSVIERTTFLALEVQPQVGAGQVKLNLGLLVGVIAGVLLLGLVFVGLILWFIIRRRKKAARAG